MTYPEDEIQSASVHNFPEFDAALLADLPKTAPVALLLCDENKRIVFANQKAEKLTGLSTQELVGQNFSDLFISRPEKRIAFWSKIEDQLNNKELSPLDLSIAKSNFHRVDLEISCSTTIYKGQTLLMLALFDITGRKAFEEVIENSYNKFIHTTIELDAAMAKISEQRKSLEEYKNRIQTELEMATKVQQAILPRDFLTNDQLDTAGLCISLSELGGDYLDVIPLGDEKYGLLAADVSGHGVPAALVTTLARVVFREHGLQYTNPAEFFFVINSALYGVLKDTGVHLTAAYCVLDLHAMQVYTSVAGHPSPLLICDRGKDMRWLGPDEGGMLLGVVPESNYAYTTQPLTSGAVIVLYTDGIIEATNENGQHFGREGLARICRREFDPATLAQKIIDETNTFLDTNPALDDRSVLAIRIKK